MMPSTVTAAPAAAFLALQGVSHAYVVDGRPRPALAPTDLTLAPGTLTSLLGPSGCGKSTLLRIAGGLLTPTNGRARIGGHPPKKAQRSGQIGFVFQDPSLLPWRTVAANVRLPFEVRRDSQASAGIDELLTLVGLAPFRDYYPHQLSGGMKQRAALARALALDPSVLLMDEPFGALDDITRTDLRYELLRLRRRLRATVLFVTHSIAEAVVLSDEVVVMTGRPGRISARIAIDLPHPRTPAIEESAEFLAYTRRLRSALREE
jgi:NitT/TauT family transport system ATP-binding protein